MINNLKFSADRINIFYFGLQVIDFNFELSIIFNYSLENPIDINYNLYIKMSLNEQKPEDQLQMLDESN